MTGNGDVSGSLELTEDPVVRIAEEAIAAAEGRTPEAPADPYAEQEAAQLAEFEAEAESLGITVDQLRGARQHGMSPSEYVAWGQRDGVSIADVDSIEAQAEAEREAQRQTEHERLVARAKARLG